jgi:gliding motility-associated-like protein
MKIQRLTVFIFFLIPLFISGQDLQFQWVRGEGGDSPDYTIATGTDALGNVYSLGTFGGTADIEAGPGVYTMTSAGPLDMFIAKHNAAGTLIWARQIGNDHLGNEGPRNMVVDPAGNLYITGFFYATLDFDPGPGVANITCTGTGYAAFLLKLDQNGNFLWAGNIAQSDYGNIGYSVAVAASGNIYVAGTFKGLTDFDPGPATYTANSLNPAQDIFISKFDNNGNFIWSKQFSGTEGQVGYSIGTDAQENVYSTGLFYGTGDFDPGPSVYNLIASSGPMGSWSDAFVSKLDANGNFVWAKQFAGSYDEMGFALIPDPTGNIIITGEFAGDTDFDPGAGVFLMAAANQEVRGFIVKLDVNGQLVWADQLGGPDAIVQPRSIARDALGDLYLTGSFILSVDFDPGSPVYQLVSPGNGATIFICKLHADGSFVFAKRLAGDLFSHASCITTDPARNLYLCGFFAGAQDFDPEAGVHILSSRGSTDGFVLKLNQCLQATSETINMIACAAYTLNGQTYTGSGTYTQHLVNLAGCDSALTLHLTIGGSVSTTNMSACDSYTWEGQTYTSSGNYSATYTGADGCDSIRKLNLIIHHSVTSSIDVSVCGGESYQGYSSTGTYTDVFVAINGCDSTRTLHLIVKPKPQQTFDITICEGADYWGHSISGTYRDTLVAMNSCDSIRILNLQVNPVKRTNTNISLCKGASYHAGGADQNSSGIYMDTLISFSGCDSIITTVLTVNDLPVPMLGADRNLCTGATILLTPGSFINYEWQDHSIGPALTVGATGIYWVKVKDSHGCEATDSMVIANLLSLPSNFLKPVDSICQYEKLQLTPAGNYNSYAWSDGSRQSSLMVQRPGRYILEVQDPNGCYGSDTTDVFSKTCRTGVFIPTAFTPGRDPLNNEFRATIYGNTVSFKLEVYSRWGELVFLTNDPYKGWNGTIKGVEVSTAVFVWRCNYQLEGGKATEEKGVVTLIR